MRSGNEAVCIWQNTFWMILIVVYQEIAERINFKFNSYEVLTKENDNVLILVSEKNVSFHVSINIKEHRLTFRIQLPIICSTIRILRKLPFILIILFPFRLLKYLNKGI